MLKHNFKKYFLFGILSLSIAVAGYAQRSDYIPDDYALTFQDEFNTLNLDIDGDGSENWAPWWVDWNIHYLNSNEDQAYKGDAETLGLEDDFLHKITNDSTLQLFCHPTPEEILSKTDQKPYVAGMISANKSFSQKYGYWEVKCKFDMGVGQLWTVWLLSDKNVWPPDIDLVELEGQDLSQFAIKAHGANPDVIEKLPIEDPSQYHLYGFEWTEDQCIWYLDGEEVWTIDAFINDAMYLLITCEIGGYLVGAPDETSPWPTKCEIDYVRIYQKSPTHVEDEKNIKIQDYELDQNYPNPFNSSTHINYQLSSEGLCRLSVFDITGKEIKVLVNERQNTGIYQVNWNGRDNRNHLVPSGYYFCQLWVQSHDQEYSYTNKMVFLK